MANGDIERTCQSLEAFTNSGQFEIIGMGFLRSLDGGLAAEGLTHAESTHARGLGLPPSLFVTNNEDDLLPGSGYRGDLAGVLGFNNVGPLSEIYLYYVYESNNGKVVEGENAWQFRNYQSGPQWADLTLTPPQNTTG
jgi:hypothetical protein